MQLDWSRTIVAEGPSPQANLKGWPAGLVDELRVAAAAAGLDILDRRAVTIWTEQLPDGTWLLRAKG